MIPKPSSGFTLLELMVVLVIMVLVYGLVTPALSTALPSTELKSATRQLAAGLRKARSMAVTRKIEATLKLDLEQFQFEVTGDDASYGLPDNIQISLTTARSERIGDEIGAIRFYPDGSSTGGRISLTSGVREFHVNVDWLTGQVKVL